MPGDSESEEGGNQRSQHVYYDTKPVEGSSSGGGGGGGGGGQSTVRHASVRGGSVCEGSNLEMLIQAPAAGAAAALARGGAAAVPVPLSSPAAAAAAHGGAAGLPVALSECPVSRIIVGRQGLPVSSVVVCAGSNSDVTCFLVLPPPSAERSNDRFAVVLVRETKDSAASVCSLCSSRHEREVWCSAVASSPAVNIFGTFSGFLTFRF